VPAPDVLVQIGGSGTAFYDVTSYTTSVTISRGLSRELDRFTTGSANLSFTNQTRAFDPFYTSSPFYPNIKPRKNMKVSTIVSGSTAVQFTGLVEDWSLDFEWVHPVWWSAVECAYGDCSDDGRAYWRRP
jgi:hypothetical protein